MCVCVYVYVQVCVCVWICVSVCVMVCVCVEHVFYIFEPLSVPLSFLHTLITFIIHTPESTPPGAEEYAKSLPPVGD